MEHYTIEQIESMESFETFRAAAGNRLAPYITDAVSEQNTTALVEWIRDTLPGGLLAAQQLGAWELSFKACLAAGTIKPDPSWTRPLSHDERIELFKKLYDSLSSDQARAVCENRIERHTRPISELQAQQLAKIGGCGVFKSFVNAR